MSAIRSGLSRPEPSHRTPAAKSTTPEAHNAVPYTYGRSAAVGLGSSGMRPRTTTSASAQAAIEPTKAGA